MLARTNIRPTAVQQDAAAGLEQDVPGLEMKRCFLPRYQEIWTCPTSAMISTSHNFLGSPWGGRDWSMGTTGWMRERRRAREEMKPNQHNLYSQHFTSRSSHGFMAQR